MIYQLDSHGLITVALFNLTNNNKIMVTKLMASQYE